MVAFALYAFGGVELQDYFQKSVYYPVIGFAGLLGLIALKVINIIKRGKTNVQGIIHDPRYGVLGRFFKDITFFFKPGRLLIASLIFFSLFGLLSVYTNTFVTAIPVVEQEVTQTGELTLATEPAASSETLFFVFLLSLMISIAAWMQEKYKWSTSVFWVAVFIIVIINGALFTGLHLARYGAEESALVSNMIFGTAGSGMTVLTGSIIPFYAWHFCNNLFFKANDMFADDAILAVTLSIMILSALIYGIYSFARRKRKERLGEIT